MPMDAMKSRRHIRIVLDATGRGLPIYMMVVAPTSTSASPPEDKLLVETAS